MPPATERPETSAPPAAPPPHPTLFSPAAFLVVLALLVVEGIGVFVLARSFGDEKSKTPSIDQKYAEVDLGQVLRDLPVGDSATMLQDTFMVQVVLVINPNFENVDELKGIVESRKNRLKDAVNQIVHQKSKEYFYSANVLEQLKVEIKQRVNQVLGAAKDGQEIISEVLFPTSRTPSIK